MGDTFEPLRRATGPANGPAIPVLDVTLNGSVAGKMPVSIIAFSDPEGGFWVADTEHPLPVNIIPTSPAAGSYLPIRLSDGTTFYVIKQYVDGVAAETPTVMAMGFKKIEGEGGSVTVTVPAVSKNDPFPVESLPTDRYSIADTDASGSTKYYGFESAAGAWYIMRETTTSGVVSYRFAAGGSGYATAWTNRATQTYELFSTTF